MWQRVGLRVLGFCYSYMAAQCSTKRKDEVARNIFGLERNKSGQHEILTK
jgi:hypothetical protein